MKDKIIYAGLIICSLCFVSYKSDMTNVEKLTAKIEELLDKGNLQAGRESYDITWMKVISVASADYSDTLTGIGINSGKLGFKILNQTNDTAGYMVLPRDNTTAIRIIIPAMSWCPVNIIKVYKNGGNRTTSLTIGK